MRLQHRENSKPRISSRSRSQASNRNPYNQRPITGLSNAGPGLNRSASAMSFRDQQPSRPATGMSQMDQYDSWRPATGAIDEDAEYYGEDGAGGGGASMYDDSMGPPPKTGATEVSIAAEDVVDEWALLNELDITAYQLEQEQRRREEAEQKFKVKTDLMNQMREKSQSQQLARTIAEHDWREQKDRLDDWNEQERRRHEKRLRRMERRRNMLLRQMEVAQQRRKSDKDRELDEGRQIAAQIREDLHEEKERTEQEREQAMEEFRLQCEENDLLQKLKTKQNQADENKAVADLDRYFSKKEEEEEQRQREIADRYNTCRIRERAHADKVAKIDSTNTYHKKTDEELDAEMMDATVKFDEKESVARAERARRKKDGLNMLERQIEEKEHRRRMEFNELLQTVGDMRDAVQEHEEEERHNRISSHLEKKNYGETLQKQRRQMDRQKADFVRGMTPNERRINLPLLERLKESTSSALASRPNTGLAPFSERSSKSVNPAAAQFAKAKKIVAKMRGTSLKFG